MLAGPDLEYPVYPVEPYLVDINEKVVTVNQRPDLDFPLPDIRWTPTWQASLKGYRRSIFRMVPVSKTPGISAKVT